MGVNATVCWLCGGGKQEIIPKARLAEGRQ